MTRPAGAIAAVACQAMQRQRAKSKPIGDAVRARRLREDGRRPMGTNLAEGIALSKMLARFTGAARRG